MQPRFTFRTLPLAGRAKEKTPTPTTGAPRDESNELQALINGDFSTVSAVAPELRFQAIGSCPVPLRASVLRVVLFKLLGTGVFAALVAAGSSDPFVAKTCGLAAAINAVAVVHYAFSAPSPIPCTCILLLTRLLCACVRSLEDPFASAQRQTPDGVDGGARSRHGCRRLRCAGLRQQLQALRAGNRRRQPEAFRRACSPSCPTTRSTHATHHCRACL